MVQGGYDVDVLVVGGGPTGLTLASTLLQSSKGAVRCRVIDKLVERVPYSKAFGVHVRTLEHWSYLGHGLLEKMTGKGKRFSRIEYHLPNNDWRVDFDEVEWDARFKGVLMVSQAVQEAILQEHLQEVGGKLERGVEMVSLVRDEEGVVVTLRHTGTGREETIRCRYVVGTDGAHSTVRKAINMSFKGSRYPELFLLADVKIQGPVLPDPDMATFSFRGRAPSIILPFGDGIFRIITTRDPSAGEHQPDLAEFETALQSICPGAKPYDPIWLSAFRLHRRNVARYNVGKVFLAGDAAHIHSPAGGQGLNTGIQDGFNLGWKLSLVLRGLAKEKPLLDTYHDERHPIGEQVLRTTDRMSTLMGLTGSSWSLFFKGAFMRVMIRLRPARRALIYTLSQINFTYHGNASVHDDGGWWWWLWSIGPLAGDRAYDGQFDHGHRVLDLLSDGGLRHVLLVFGGDGEGLGEVVEEMKKYPTDVFRCVLVGKGGEKGVPKGWEKVGDEEGKVHLAYGGGKGVRCLYLIRPDGYVGYRCRGWGIHGLSSFLKRQGYVMTTNT